jgi:putative ABC transport system permease protein
MLTETFLRDLRVGLRVLVKEKSFCALAVFVLALGICSVTTMFSVVNGVMLRGFSFPNADRLASATFLDPTTVSAFGFNGRILPMDFQELAPQQQSFEMMAQYLAGSTVNMTVDGQPRRYQGAYVTENFLRILGVSPILGRDITADDNKPGAEKVAIIGYGLWQRDFGGASNIVGKGVRLNGKPATIIGVMAQGFAFPTNEELWIPLYSEFPVKPRNDPNQNSGLVLGLLKRGVSIDQANAEFTGLAKRFADAYPDTSKRFNRGQVEPLLNTYTPRPIRATLWTMLGFCVGVLLIACVNVMNMQFARATLRARELAIRSSLGATRGRLITQMLTESLLVAGIGAVLGIGLAYLSIDWVSAAIHNLDTPPPSWMVFDVSGLVLAVTVVSTVGAAIASGLLPAWMSSRANVVEVLRDSGRGNTSSAINVISRGLVVFQIVVTCILLIGSILQVRSILNQQQIDYGYDTGALMSARMGLMEGDYPTPDAKKIFFDRLVRQLNDNPEFDGAALTNRFRMAFNGNGPIEIEGKEYKADRDRPLASFEQVTPTYFGVMGQKLVEGRNFADDDLDSKQPVAIVNAALARKLFGNETPVGRRFRSSDANGQHPGTWRTIVGVVTTIRMLGPFNNPGLDDSGYYVPFYAAPVGPAATTPNATQFATVVIKPRSGQRAESIINTLRREVAKADPNLPLYFIGTPKVNVDAFIAASRVIATMFSIFGGIAILLASVGIYGVMSFAVNQRTQEFGVRMALGADTPRILSMVLKQGSVQIGLGVFVGVLLCLGIALAFGSGIQTVLFGVSARDPFTYSVVIGLVTVVSLVATLVPARRATRVDPMIALRAE